jgi:CO dehydrogenase maturation factor
MSYTIAIAGKGGTGKTTIAALLVRLFKDANKQAILAVDADPNSSLAEALDVEVKETIGSILDEVASAPDKIPAGMSKERFIEYRLQSAVVEAEGFDLLTMGKPEGPGCYCYVNNVLRNTLSRLIGDYDYVIIDNEAGLEHLSRKTNRVTDVLLVVSDATAAGLRSAERISSLTKELKIEAKLRFLLVNRYRDKFRLGRIKVSDLEYLGNVPDDPQIFKMSLKGTSFFRLKADTAALVSLANLIPHLLGGQ